MVVVGEQKGGAAEEQRTLSMIDSFYIRMNSVRRSIAGPGQSGGNKAPMSEFQACSSHTTIRAFLVLSRRLTVSVFIFQMWML